MLKQACLSGALIFCAGTTVEAQSAARSAEVAFARAQELASDGNTAAGRALIDSVIKTTAPASPIYPQALYWRATLATSAAEAESDYRHIVVDYPLAPHAEDALLRLAQLELARGDRDDALLHLQRISRDYPRSKSLARSNYWIARVLFEKNDIAGACAANEKALAQTTEGEVELRNQIQYQSQRCTSYAAAQRAANSAAVPAESTSTAARRTSPSVASSTPSAASSTPPVVAATPVQSAPPPRMIPPTQGNDTKPSQVEQPPMERAAEISSKAASSTTVRTWSVQVAAYNRKSEAEKLAVTLEKRGYDARVDGTVAPFRVRIGRYATAGAAESALREIKSKRMAGFVVRAP
ncbi:MAG: SPOR domain-containing protein [Gemmatimonadota bacterium]|nr:SPOR domain-containing protein [Gemmatimonadota bacterium]